jgi:hypothetical protein
MRHEILIRYLSTLQLMEMQHVILSQNASVSAIDTAHMRDLNVRSLYLLRQFNKSAGLLRYTSHPGIETDQTIPS